MKKPEERRTSPFKVYLYPRHKNAKENNRHEGFVVCVNSKVEKHFKNIGKLTDFLLEQQVKFEKEFMKDPKERKRLGYK